MHHVYLFVGIMLIISIAIQFLRATMGLREGMWQHRLAQKFEDIKVKKVASLDVGRITDPEFIELKSMFWRGENAVGRIWQTQADLFGAILGIVLSLGVLSIVDPLVIAVMFIPVIPALIKTLVVENRLRKLNERQVLTSRRQHEYELCITHRTLSVQTKLFCFTKYFISRYFYFRDKLMEEKLEHERFERKAGMTIGSIQSVSSVLVLMYLGHGLVSGNLDMFKIMVIYGSVRTFAWKCEAFSFKLGELSSQHVDFQYYDRFHATKPLVDETGAQEVTFDRTPDLVLDNVDFVYPRQEGRQALTGCSLSIRPGEKIALIGQNGSGKTTVLRVLSKIFVPHSGAVKIGGIDVTSIQQASLHEQLLCVTQENGVPDLTIEEAITGSSSEDVDPFRLAQAAHIAGSDQFIALLPEGFKSQIGEEWPGGVGFSAGQMQRIKLTAALYRLLDLRTHVVLFDEPMSHCDPETRLRFYSSLKNFSAKTIVVVAHDMDCLPHFDRLIIMRDGRVVDEVVGTEAILQYRDRVALDLAHEF